MPRPTIDAVVDASPPPVGFAGVRGGLADSLRALGARVAPGRRGVAIGPDAVCAGLPRLACAGGVTKEFAPCALGQGSDRLLDRWAQALLVRCEWADADSLPLDAGRTQRAG